MIKIAIICGGPSLERGISLNSARSLLDHLPLNRFEIFPFYVDQEKQFHKISTSQLYSNTPSDFDFKLKQIAEKLEMEELITHLKSVDLVFPVIHGPFGEDGDLQEFLEENNIAFIGSDHTTCRQIFFKHQANKKLKKLGFPVHPYVVITPKTKKIPSIHEKTIIKPSSGGSSIGVYSVNTQEDAEKKIAHLFSLFEDKHVLLEPFCQGKEFTVVVIDHPSKGLIALTPTEIEISYENHQIFDYRKKYLPTNQTAYHTPPRFAKNVIDQIQAQAKELFVKLKIQDFIRIDGWVMPNEAIYFSDFNIACGLEQNSFLFRQASVDGFTHEEILSAVIENACKRHSIAFPFKEPLKKKEKRKVFVLFGGKNAERQVSLMSGTNVWLKLIYSEKYESIPFFLDINECIWKLPYSFALNHTVEEVLANCLMSQNPRLSIDEWLDFVKKENAFVFIALHGGFGENGTLQSKLEKQQIPFNGSNAITSQLCMDKVISGKKIQEEKDPDIFSLPKEIISFSNTNLDHIFDRTKEKFHATRLIIKPKEDGCSAGIVLLESQDDFNRYAHFVKNKIGHIPPFSFARQAAPIEMPSSSQDFLLEPYIETDLIMIDKNDLSIATKTGWIELTVGVLEENHQYRSLNPSITIAEGSVLSLEEKFQGGTGVNITPPPESILSSFLLEKLKRMIEKTARVLNIQGYARIDIFFHRFTGQMIFIEANTLPGLTPSTVLYHQALAETPPLIPRQFLEKVIDTVICKKEAHHA